MPTATLTACTVAACGTHPETCRHCGQPIAYIPEHWHDGRAGHVFRQSWHDGQRCYCHDMPAQPRRYVLGTGWTHLDGRVICQHVGASITGAEPVPHCPRCGETEGPRYGTRNTPYGMQTDCTACGYSHYFSIGD